MCYSRAFFFFGRRSILGESVFGAGAGRCGHFRGCSPTVCCVETVLGSPCRDLYVNPVVGRALVVVWCKFRKRQEREKGEEGKGKRKGRGKGKGEGKATHRIRFAAHGRKKARDAVGLSYRLYKLPPPAFPGTNGYKMLMPICLEIGIAGGSEPYLYI